VKKRLKLHNLCTDHVVIRSELKYLIGAKMVNFKCLVFDCKTAPFPTVQVFRVVRPVATVRIWVDPDPDPTRQFGPVARTAPGDAAESLLFPIPLHPAASPTSYLMGLSVAWTASAGGSGSWPRMASSALSDGLNCCKQTLPKVTVLPSYPARSWRRLISTVPRSGFAVPSGHRSVDGRRSTACG